MKYQARPLSMSFEPNDRNSRLPYRARRSLLIGHRQRQAATEDNKALMCCLYLFAFAMISITYVIYTSSVWKYTGLVLSISYTKIFFSLVVLIAFVLFTPSKWSARALFLNIILTTSILPSLVLFGFADKPTFSAIVVWSSVAIVYVVSGISVTRVKVLYLSPQHVMWVLLLFCAALIGIFVLLGGFRFFNLDFSRVYEFRDDASDALPGIFGYISTTFSNAVVPLGIAISLHYRNYLNAVLFVGFSVIMFGLTSHKTMMFTPFIVAAVYFLATYQPKYKYILYAFCALAAIVAVAVLFVPYFSVNSFWGWLENLFIRRMLMVPAMLDFSYINFFQDHDQYYWSTSRITLGLLDVPHNGISPPEMIGLAHFGTTSAWADTGFIGSGFAQAGVLGAVVYSIAVGLTIAIFQSFSRDLGIPLVVSATLGLFATMIHASDFVSLFLTHGLMVTLIILISLHDEKLDRRGSDRIAKTSLRAGRFSVKEKRANTIRPKSV